MRRRRADGMVAGRHPLPDGRRAQQVGLSRIHRPIIGHDRSSAGLASRIILLAPAAMPRARQWAAISCCPCATTGTVQVVLSTAPPGRRSVGTMTASCNKRPTAVAPVSTAKLKTQSCGCVFGLIKPVYKKAAVQEGWKALHGNQPRFGTTQAS